MLFNNNKQSENKEIIDFINRILKEKTVELKKIDKELPKKLEIFMNSNNNSTIVDLKKHIEEYQILQLSKDEEISKLNDIITSKQNEINRLNKIIEDLKNNSPKTTNVGSLTLPQSSNFTENIKKLNNGFSSINNNLKENRTKSVLRGGGSLLNNGFKTSLHKYSGILRKNNSQQIPKKSAGKIFMYNNTSDYLKNMINNIKYNSNNLDINKKNNVKKNNSNN